MTELDRVLGTLIEEGTAARAHFHTWWALKNIAMPDHFTTMNNFNYVDFFHVSNSGNYKLIFVALSKIYDRDSRAAGICKLKDELNKAEHGGIADEVAKRVDAHQHLIQKILKIRNKSISHNEADITRKEVYMNNELTPDNIRELIDVTCETINYVSRELGISSITSDPERYEKAVHNLLETLAKGQT